MRSVLAALALLAGASAASAEVWLMREGRCGEYRSRWDVEQDQPGVWVGAADHVQVGGPCVARTGVNSRSRVRAVIVGQEFFAILQSEPASGAAVPARLWIGACAGADLKSQASLVSFSWSVWPLARRHEDRI